MAAGAAVLAQDESLLWVATISATALALALVGFADDARGLKVKPRLVAQGLIGLTAGLVITTTSDLAPVVATLLIAGGIIAGTNIFNFMDGADGVSGFHGVLFGAVFVILGILAVLPWLAITGAAQAAASAGFLPWNLGREKVFGGDAGSYMMGGAFSVAAIAAVVSGVPIVLLVAPFTIYLADTTVTLARRIVTGQEWHRSHRSHYYQQLSTMGWSHTAVAAITVGFSTLAFSVALSFELVLELPVAAAFAVVGVGLLYLAVVMTLLRHSTEGAPSLPPDSALPPRAYGALWERWTVVGASGFIGARIVQDLRGHDLVVKELSAPRVCSPRRERQVELLTVARQHESVIAALAIQFAGQETIVNAAGLATPAAAESDDLSGANALLPVIIALAAARAGAYRVVHLSSAASQGRRRMLDESAETEPFSAYSLSKSDGELALLELCEQLNLEGPEIVIVRATSVHGAGTEKVRNLRRVAASPVASVAGAGDATTVLSSLDDFTRFVHWVGSWPEDLPTILLQPDEGLRTADILRLASGREPRHLPPWLCHVGIAVAYTLAAAVPSLRARVRRVELMWFGQRMAPTWGAAQGWVPSEALSRMIQEAEGPLATSETARRR
jgi:UDP-N-acetylmuramyl pentapeptide phosphotransferase/UDP-N-acetylglucosamine-1-phosphate transferase/nucleoside-diphosphate-sugar epimerase